MFDLCSVQVSYKGRFMHIKLTCDVLWRPPLKLTEVKLIPLYQLQKNDQNQNQDVKYPEENRGHWSSSDVTKNDSRPLGHGWLTTIHGLMTYRKMEYTLIKPSSDDTCKIDYNYMCIGTDCKTKSFFLIPIKIISIIITVYITLHWLSNNNRFKTYCQCSFVYIKRMFLILCDKCMVFRTHV